MLKRAINLQIPNSGLSSSVYLPVCRRNAEAVEVHAGGGRVGATHSVCDGYSQGVALYTRRQIFIIRPLLIDRFPRTMHARFG